MSENQRYGPNRWAGLEQFQVPCQIFRDNKLSLSPSATATLMFLYFKAKGRCKQLLRQGAPSGDRSINVIASQKEASSKTGYSRNTLTSAVRELVADRWLETPAQRRISRGELGTNEYFLLDPKTGQRLQTLPVSPYFTVPTCIIQKNKMHWSLCSMSPSDIALYTTMLFKANQCRKNTFSSDLVLLRKMSKLTCGSEGAFSKALESLQIKGLIVTDSDQITLCNPLTGEPPVAALDAVNDPANYFTSAGIRIVFNVGNPHALLKWVEASLPAGEYLIQEANGEYKLKCPFHPDRNPSLNFNAAKNTFHCFGCYAKGTTKKLVMQLAGISESEAIQQHSRAIGIDPVFEPDSDAEAKYLYTDQSGEPVYRVLRYPGKQFSQQHWTPEGWVHNLKGVKKTLYNCCEIDCAATVIVTEGEKDADRVNELRLKDFTGRRILATTSGGANSWQDGFADLLASPCFRIPANVLQVDSRYVIVMPDSDAPGQEYKEQVVRSLKKRAIPHCVVTLAGFKDVSEYLDAGHTGQELAQRIDDECKKIDGSRIVIDFQTAPAEDISI
jgi:hypothetical protein